MSETGGDGARFNSEFEARSYVLQFCAQSGLMCSRCGETRAYKLKDGRSRCASCQFTYHDLTGRWINRAKLSCASWLSAIELFVEDTTVHYAAKELGVAYNTAFKAYRNIRLSIFHHALGETAWQTSLFEPPRKDGDVEMAPPEPVRHLVFSMNDAAEGVVVVPVPDLGTQEALDACRTKTATGGIVFTGKHGDDDHLIFCETSKVLAPYGRDFVRGRVYLRDDPFWQFGRERINLHHRISPRWFPFYLKELVFRYNNLNRNIHEEILRCLCCFIPKT